MVILVLLSMVTACGWAFDDEQNQKTIYGTIVNTDWVNSIITVRCSDSISGDADEINIVVPREAKITSGSSTISFSDINQSDQATVTYYDDGLSGLKAVRISDLNQANRGL